jgi:hypothetical protein
MVQVVTVCMMTTAIRTVGTAMVVVVTMMTIVTNTGRIVPTGVMEQAFEPDPAHRGEAWGVPPECREAVVAVVARFGLAQV